LGFDPSIFLSLAFLFGIAAQFRAMDGNTFLRALIAVLEERVGLLYAVVIVTAVFSPFILNDVLVLILTPVLVSYSKETRTDIAPLLVAEVTFTNIASCLTPLGNPQNILLWQASGISAARFVEGTWSPVLASGMIAASLLLVFRGRRVKIPDVRLTAQMARPSVYLIGTAVIVFALNFLGVSSLVALGAAFSLGFFFTHRSLVKLALEFDARSMLVLWALVGAVALAAIAVGPSITPFVGPAAAGEEPFTSGFFALVSAVISNVPATQLVLSTAHVSAHAAPILAVDAGLAGNIDPISSFANLLALQIVARNGLALRRTVLLQLVVGLIAFAPALL
jgi:Na+/H+ antiporter NhaD/arsenite permease-like protein